jgi:hypothetical protein
MSIKVTLEFADAESAITALAKLRAPETKDVASPKADKPSKPTTPAKTEAAAPTPPTAQASPAAPAAAPATQPPAPSAPAGPTFDDVKAAIAITAATDRPRAVATLAKFGAKAGKDLKPEQYAAFVAELTADNDDLAG